jgi:hypothetical protein
MTDFLGELNAEIGVFLLTLVMELFFEEVMIKKNEQIGLL